MPPPLECPFPKLHPSELVRDDAFYMALAYNQAVEAWRGDEVPIGAVIVHSSGEVIAAAHNAVDSLHDPTAHAEILAITQASAHLGNWRLNECTLYVTKEPCPMCAGASVMARLGRVVFGWGDPKMGCLGGAAAVHELPRLNHRVSVASGVLEDECRSILQAYFVMKRTENKTEFSDGTDGAGVTPPPSRTGL
ncbi:MAG: tRNA adenosine(34) deaminase TadA [Puniceicoccales bacterium]|jgi:tRNA(adenine34) deaminase|nr:tRNA adenosine(34) deaminase TadA [Puniceicoccales bacterium]